MRALATALLLVTACDDYDDVVGPFTGESRRFVVDSFELPTSGKEAQEMGGELDDLVGPDNQLGMVIGVTLSTYEVDRAHEYSDVSRHGRDMINAGVIASSVIITADDFMNDPSVSVKYVGSDDDAAAIVVGGRLVDGRFEPNPSLETGVPGATTLHLPVFADADPSVLPIIGLEIELVPDGRGGYAAELHGAALADAVMNEAARGMAEMIAARPADRLKLSRFLDSFPPDGVIDPVEVTWNGFIVSLLSRDIIYRGTPAVSLGLRVHLTPCPTGRCEVPQISCFNRVRDGNEEHVDCGGDCRGCLEGATCDDALDCESRDCNAGVCGPSSCTNGVRDGFETDVDCGHGCAPCAVGQTCFFDTDCASQTCGEPCHDCSERYDTCRSM